MAGTMSAAIKYAMEAASATCGRTASPTPQHGAGSLWDGRGHPGAAAGVNVIFVFIFPSLRAPIGITYKKKIILRLKITPAPLAPTP